MLERDDRLPLAQQLGCEFSHVLWAEAQDRCPLVPARVECRGGELLMIGGGTLEEPAEGGAVETRGAP